VQSPLQSAFIELFRTNIHCALRLAREIGIDLHTPLEWWRVVDGIFADPGGCGRSYSADLVVASFAPGIEYPALEALILAPTIEFDPDKATSWLVQRAGVASRYGVSGLWLLVISPDEHVITRYRDEVYLRNPELMPRFVGPGSLLLPAIRA
jgi:hypothetical protein